SDRSPPPRPEFFLGGALDDPEVALDGVAEHAQRLAVLRAVVRGLGLLDRLPLDDHHALVEALLVHRGRHAAHDEAAAELLDRGAGELRVGAPLFLVVDLAVVRDPVAFCHLQSPYVFGLVQLSDHASTQLDERRPPRSCGNTLAEDASPFTESCALSAG